ncbi:recombinase family protein [Rivularia sp. UHCC 0363]|uniref:recombinase family protein n=1 Tax=Rivularia sp. UHCC 0363 TaxID=3110244 RepID=UPI002B2089DE|nr:recombinase family protein [Rivularia sp. UHCC 0363]MEA5592989.1 recombinase family protein [Rivularia sp. UHCC 0363]
MLNHSLWIEGPSRSGKTERLVQQFCIWVNNGDQNQEIFYTTNPSRKNTLSIPKSLYLQHNELGALVFAANGDNRRELADKIVTATWGKYPVKVKTPLGFFQDEVILFWPLLIESLALKAQFPVRLRPETEQELATKLWNSRLDEEILRSVGMNQSRLVRRILDLMQLAALSGTSCEDISQVLTRVSSPQQDNFTNLEPDLIGSLLLDWRSWCLDKGFLTYGIITELYGQNLLSDNNYLSRLKKRYQAVLADDVQDYPALMRQLFELILDDGVGAFSYNPDGIIRLGLGADPNYMEGLAQHCQRETLTQLPVSSLSDLLSNSMTQLVTEPMTLLSLPLSVQSIQTTSRAALLQETAEVIIKTVESGIVQPQEIAIIAPGLDAIARYALIEKFTKAGIAVNSLQDQRPLISSPIVRALLTLITLVYPGLGRLLDRDAIAEMLVVLSRKPNNHEIDPVRAGLIADYCFQPHPDNPNLLSVDTFERWDRLGYAATTAYGKILKWLEQERSNYEKRLIPTPVSFLYGAIEYFIADAGYSNYEQLAILRQLLETAQHYWEIDTRLNQYASPKISLNSSQSLEEREKEAVYKQDKTKTIADFIGLLRKGTVTASPYPIRPIGPLANAVTLATIFQYRSLRHSHSWHFWLDVGSPLWTKGGAATLFGSMFFLQERFAQPWSAEDEKSAEDERLERIIADLLARVSDKIYLCHSELAVNGQEQLGSLLPLVNACVGVDNEELGVKS